MLCLLKKKGRSQVSWKTLRFPIWCWLYPLIISSLLHSVAMSMPLRRPCVWLRYDYYSETMMSVELDYSTCTQMRSERQRTFDLENALICSWRTPMFDRDYHVYYYMGLMRNCQHDIFFFCFLTLQTGISSPAFVLYITLVVCQQISVGC